MDAPPRHRSGRAARHQASRAAFCIQPKEVNHARTVPQQAPRIRQRHPSRRRQTLRQTGRHPERPGKTLTRLRRSSQRHRQGLDGSPRHHLVAPHQAQGQGHRHRNDAQADQGNRLARTQERPQRLRPPRQGNVRPLRPRRRPLRPRPRLQQSEQPPGLPLRRTHGRRLRSAGRQAGVLRSPETPPTQENSPARQPALPGGRTLRVLPREVRPLPPDRHRRQGLPQLPPQALPHPRPHHPRRRGGAPTRLGRRRPPLHRLHPRTVPRRPRRLPHHPRRRRPRHRPLEGRSIPQRGRPLSPKTGEGWGEGSP